MEKQEQPFESFVSNVLQQFGRQEAEVHTVMQNSILDLESMLGDKFPKSTEEYLKKRFKHARFASKSPLIVQLEQELSQIMGSYEHTTQHKMNVGEIQKKIKSWNLKVIHTNISQEEQNILLEKGLIAIQFAQTH